MFDRYKTHHKILEVLFNIYVKHSKGDGVDNELFYRDSLQIHCEIYGKPKGLDDRTPFKTNQALDELCEANHISKTEHPTGYIYRIVSPYGITAHKTEFYLEKQGEHKNRRLRERTSFIVGILAIISFFITTTLLIYKKNTIEIELLEYKTTYIECGQEEENSCHTNIENDSTNHIEGITKQQE